MCNMAKARLRWLLTACFLLVVLALVGHFVSDLFTDTVDALLTIDLHSGFLMLPTLALALVLHRMGWALWPMWTAAGWRHPPQTPPPLFCA
jgi:hypothetical protein